MLFSVAYMILFCFLLFDKLLGDNHAGDFGGQRTSDIANYLGIEGVDDGDHTVSGQELKFIPHDIQQVICGNGQAHGAEPTVELHEAAVVVDALWGEDEANDAIFGGFTYKEHFFIFAQGQTTRVRQTVIRQRPHKRQLQIDHEDTALMISKIPSSDRERTR